VLPTFLEKKAAFEYEQTIDTVYRETPHTPAITEKLTHQGFFLVESGLSSESPTPAVLRLLTQYILTPQTLKNLLHIPEARRLPLLDEHTEQYFLPAKPFGLEIPIEIISDLQHTNPRPTGSPDTAMPFDAMHLPTVTPTYPMPQQNLAVGLTWTPTINVKCGFGRFPLAYTVRCAALTAESVTFELAFEHQERAASLKGITLVFRPSGTWNVNVLRLTGAPLSAAGNLQFSVHGSVERTRESAEILNTKLSFQWTRVPLDFTNAHLITPAWAAFKSASAPNPDRNPPDRPTG
jgi:hypothetical protein